MENERDVINTFRGILPQFFAAVSGTLFSISDGMTTGWTAPMIPYLISENSHIKTTLHEAEWLETALLVGALCGLPTTIYFTQKIGRKRSLLLASTVVIIAWITIALVDKLIYMHVARFFSGMAGNMAFVSAPMYISEIADHKIRGFLSSTIFTMFLLGVFIMYCVGPYLPYYGAPLIGGGFAFIELVTFSFMPESPYYLYSKNKIEEAEKSLRYFKRYANVEQEMKNIAESLEKEKTEKGNFKSLFIAKNNRKAVLIMTVLNAGQNFSGIMVIFMNLHLILNQAGSIYITDSLAGILFATTTLVAVCVASLLIDRCGRKALLITSSILTGACLLTIAIYFHLKFSGYDVLTVSWIPIVFVMIYAASFKLGMGLVPIVITAEIFSPKVKAIGMTLADASYVLWGIVSLQVYQWVTHLSGLHASFYVFSLSSFLLGVFTLLYIPETKGKTLEEIQTVLKGEELTTNEPREGQVDIPLMKLED